MSDFSVGFRLPRSRRISSAVDFRLFRSSGDRRKCVGYLLARKQSDNPSSPPRIGFIASRKVGNAVRRNRLRRVFRERFRHLPVNNLLGNDFLIIFLAESKTMNPTAMVEDFIEILSKKSGAGSKPPRANHNN